jgi:hypothetical protein
MSAASLGSCLCTFQRSKSHQSPNGAPQDYPADASIAHQGEDLFKKNA